MFLLLQPLGAINLTRCLPSQPPINTTTGTYSGHKQQDPAAPAPPDLCARPNTLQLILYNNDNHHNLNDGDSIQIIDSIENTLLLSADTANERREWCETINGAVYALGEYHNQIRLADVFYSKQIIEKEKEKKNCSEEQHSTAWTMTSNASTNNCGKKKKFYK